MRELAEPWSEQTGTATVPGNVPVPPLTALLRSRPVPTEGLREHARRWASGPAFGLCAYLAPGNRLVRGPSGRQQFVFKNP